MIAAQAFSFFKNGFWLPVTLIVGLVLLRWQFGIPLFHTFVELFSVLVSILMMVIAWQTHHFTRNYFLLWLGIGYFNLAILDICHAFTMRGMSLFPTANEQTSLHFWLYARLAEALLLLAAPLFLNNMFNKHMFNKNIVLPCSLTFTAVLVWLAFKFEQPILLDAAGLTTTKLVWAYVIIGILSLTFGLYWRIRAAFTAHVRNYLLAAIVVTLMSEFVFTLYIELSSVYFVVGHLLKFLSYWFIYQAIIQTMLTKPFAMLARHSGLYDAIPHIAIVSDTTGNIIQFNKAALKFLARPLQQLSSQSEHELFHQASLTTELCPLCQATAKGAKLDNFLLQRSDLNQWFIVSSAPATIGRAQLGMVYVYTDITSTKLAEQKAAQSKAIIDSVIQALPDIFILMDFNGKVIDYHANNEQQLYLARSEIIGKQIQQVLSDDAASLYSQYLTQVQEANSIICFEYPMEVNQQYRYFEARLSQSVDGQHIVAIVRDIHDRKVAENKLKHNEQLYRQMFEENRAIKLIIDPLDGHIIQANQAAIEFYGYGNSLLNKRITDIRVDQQSTVVNDMQLAEQQQKSIFNFQHRVASGAIKQVEVYSGPIKVGAKTFLYSIIQDVTEREQAQKSLLAKEKQLQDLFDNTTSIIYIKDLSGRYVSVNQQYERLFNTTEAEIYGKTDYDLFPAETAQQFRANDQQAIAQNAPLETEESMTYADREHFYISVKFPLKNDEDEIYGVCGVSTDITERKEAEQMAFHQAHFDSLTSLPNRFLSLDRLSRMLAEAKRNNELVAVLFLDLDDFKKINDSLGHEVGDKLLIEAAGRLNNIVRGDDTVGRLGGDEFIILLRQLSNSSYAQPVIDQLIRAFREPFQIDGRELLLTLSVGIAIYPENGLTGSELLRNADSAMYHAKDCGRNTFSYFTDEMNQQVSRRLAIEEQIHGALERGEFSVNYQPQIDVASGEIIGAEALIRWFNPTLKQVSPAEFIPIAEQSGLIITLGQFVLEHALEVITHWQQHYPSSLRIAVNLSPRQFRDPKLVDFVAHALKQSGVSADRLELEITEGVLLSGHNFVETALRNLAGLGVVLSMDDFGTGYSSLSYLRKFPFNVLKIDRCFVNGLTQTVADRELVHASIALAHSLGLKVVAEGVETAEQLAILGKLNCDYAQGFYMAKPMTEQQLMSFKLTCFS